MHLLRSAALLASALLTGCSSCKDPGKAPGDDSFAVKPEPPAGDPERGRALVAELQCNRCHDGTGHTEAQLDKHCVRCHQRIVDGTFKADADTLAKWQPIVRDLTEAPSLESAGKRFRRGWLESFLVQPHDIRPKLVATMPRLAITREQARDVAAHLARDVVPAAPFAPGDAERGRRLLESKGCGTCHKLTGAPAPLAASAIPTEIDAKQMARAMTLAPDLRFARDRSTPSAAAAWIADPKSVSSDASMPKIPLGPNDPRDIVTYLFTVKLSDQRPAAFKRLPPLDRPVKFEEVNKKVFHKTCWHCHSEPDFAIGDGGPGNSGGFGFKPRGVDLSSYQAISSGYLTDDGSRKSLFVPAKSGLPRMVDALVARHAEEAGAATGELRGMPLGLPALTAEEIQLVESWISQGRPK
jgi:cytochrome c2